MLPTFVIGLREGLEAALIVGFVAAFLRRSGRTDLLRWVFAGVAAAIALCFAVGIVLDVVSRNLPQRQQEGLETVIGALAVGMVTYMVVWMRRHARDLKGQLEGAAGEALATGSAWALVVMAFLAVLREGFETVVFLLAAFNESGSGATSGLGAVLGILLSAALGVGIYRGGVRLNLSKFFRITGVVLVLVAAGLVVSALHTAHEAGWLDAGQQPTVDLSSVVRPGSVQSSLLTGVLGVQARPVLIEVVGWLVYLVPVGIYVAWPPGRALARRTTRRLLLTGGAVALVAAVLFTVLLPAAPTRNPRTVTNDGVSTQLVDSDPGPVLRSNAAAGTGRLTAGPFRDSVVQRTGTATHAGLATTVYSGVFSPPSPQRSTMTYAELAAANGGRLPLGVRTADTGASVPVTITTGFSMTVWADASSGRVVDLRSQTTRTVTADLSIGTTTIGAPGATTLGLPAADVTAAVARAHDDAEQLSDRHASTVGAVACGFAAIAAFAGALALTLGDRRRRAEEPAPVAPSNRALVRS